MIIRGSDINDVFYSFFLYLSNMKSTQPKEPDQDSAGNKWNRRDQKRRPRMRLHGQGMKKLAAKLGEPAGSTKTAKKKKARG
jgi:hypothetical protein